MATTIIPKHKYKEEVLEWKCIDGKPYFFGLFTEKLIVYNKIGCYCGKSKTDRIHKKLRIDRL